MRYAWFRRPRNAATKRELLRVYATLRGVDAPPSSYDDIQRCVQRSWKKHRRTQFHQNGERHANRA